MNIEKAKQLIEFITESGKRIATKSGNIKDIGILKQYLTEEDLTIERGIKEITSHISGTSSFYAEEEHDNFIDDESVWVCDPISGTKLFIQGLPNYTIVASHISKGEVDFAVVYNPSNGDLYTADSENGAFLNGTRLSITTKPAKRIIFAPTGNGSVSEELIKSIKDKLSESFEVSPSQGSMAINYCLVASGKFDGVVSITKDSFPEFAGCFIANRAGYTATNISGDKTIKPSDRLFACGSENHPKLLEILKSETVSYYECPKDFLLSKEADVLRLFEKLYPKKLLLIKQNNLAPEFFDLSTGLAGEILQKLVNYRIATAFIVDLKSVKSEKFGEMVNEANFGNEFRFFESYEAATTWLNTLTEG